MLKKLLIFIPFTLVGMLYAQEEKSSERKKKPNILYLMTDDHAVNGIGAYGGRFQYLNPSPNIDRLAKEGVMFDRAFVTNAICTPSRASIMTGTYSHKNGCYGFREGLKPEELTFPILLKEQGYQTAVIGKWHLLNEPAVFDYYAVLEGQGHYFNPTFRMSDKGKWPNNEFRYNEYDDLHSTDAITRIGLQWLKEKRDPDTPFVLFQQYKAPHDNFVNAERYDWLYEGETLPEPESLRTRGNHGPKNADQYGTSVGKRNSRRNMGHHMAVDESLSDSDYLGESYQRYMKKYLRCVKGVDDSIGKILAYLEEIGELDNTIIIYTSDQGFMLGEHDYIDKRWMYEETIRTPFIVRYPEMITPGTVDSRMVINEDYAPTFLEMVGLKPEDQPEQFQGISLLEALKGNAEFKTRDAIYYRYWLHMAHHDNPAHFGIRTDTHKLIFFYGLPCGIDNGYDKPFPPTKPYWELYNIAEDPMEMNNIIGEEGTEETFKALKEQLKELRVQFDDLDPEYPEVNERFEKTNPYSVD